MPMKTTLALDVYGTLIDPLGIAAALQALIGERAAAFAQAWREKQLEYTFRRALMRDYRDFPTCTRQALEFVDARFGTALAADAIEALMRKYVELPAYPETRAALSALRREDRRCHAFSNGHPDDLGRLLEHAGLRELLDGVVSVHPLASYKPDPAVYRHFLESTGATAQCCWLVSGNSFDILGAHRAGWRTAWVRRDPTAVFDPWGSEPTLTVASLAELAEALRAWQREG
jgi:2-haloacid dehalogenase